MYGVFIYIPRGTQPQYTAGGVFCIMSFIVDARAYYRTLPVYGPPRDILGGRKSKISRWRAPTAFWGGREKKIRNFTLGFTSLSR